MAPTGSKPGRPRRFDEQTERRLLLDAAVEVMSGRGYPEVTVAEVLAEAGLSTRAFYRHFASRDALLVSIMRRDAEAVGRMLDEVVDHAADPVQAVGGWLDGYLAVFYEPRRARRTTLYASPGVRASPTVQAEHAELRQMVLRSLVRALRAGQRAGVLRSTHPQRDAATIQALVTVAVLGPDGYRTRAAARGHVVRFVWPALGLPVS